MATELRFLIDTLDRGQPLNPEDFGININEDETIGARIVSFDNELIFGGDVFSYLYTKLSTSGYCELVRVEVQYICSSGTWERLVEGYIIATESIFDLDRCEVKAKIYDETFSTKINNNKGIPFSTAIDKSKNGTTIIPPTKIDLYVFEPNVNYYPTPAKGFPVYEVLKHLINCMSDGLIDFDSNYFAATYPQSDVIFYTNGQSIRVKGDSDIVARFDELYNALRLKLNLGMGFERQANGRPLIRIEPIAYFQQSNASVNLYDQPNIEMKFDTSRLYQAAEFGNELMLEQNECDNGNTACEFIQTPFRGFRRERFGFIGECNTSNILQLSTGQIIFDTNLIQDIVQFNNDGFDTNGVIMMTNWTGTFGAGSARARQFDPLLIGNQIYNGPFTNDNVSANWLSGYPNSLFSFLEQPFGQAQTYFEATRATQQFETTTVFDSFVGFNGFYPSWIEQVDNGNNFNTTTYTIPFTGLYTFFVQYTLSFFPAVFDKFAYATIDHLDSSAVMINSYQSAVSFQPGGIGSVGRVFVFFQKSFIANPGDLVRTNVFARSTFTSGNTDVFLDPALSNGFETITSYFSGFGEPLAPPELEPVDINDVQAYLYKFNRPLTMAEINAITSETSKPILLGRQDDILAVSNTYIKNIQIESVMRKNAQFELRSNKLLP